MTTTDTNAAAERVTFALLADHSTAHLIRALDGLGAAEITAALLRDPITSRTVAVMLSEALDEDDRRRRRPRLRRQCQHCAHLFDAKQANRAYCSNGCRQAAFRARRRAEVTS